MPPFNFLKQTYIDATKSKKKETSGHKKKSKKGKKEKKPDSDEDDDDDDDDGDDDGVNEEDNRYKAYEFGTAALRHWRSASIARSANRG